MGALSALLGNRTAQKSNLCDDIFWHGRTDARTDGRTSWNQYTTFRSASWGGVMINLIIHMLLIYLIVIFSAVFTSYDDDSQPMDTFLLCLP